MKYAYFDQVNELYLHEHIQSLLFKEGAQIYMF